MARVLTRKAVVLATVAAVCASGAFGAACGSSSESGGFVGSGDGGLETSTADVALSDATSDTGAADGQQPTDGGAPDAPVPPTTALFLHGSPSLPSVRLCWGDGVVVEPGTTPFPGDGVMPASNYPGIPPGGAAAIDDALDHTTKWVVLYAVDAKQIQYVEKAAATTFSCDQLVCLNGATGQGCLTANFHYWQLALPASGLLAERDNVVTLAGCFGSFVDPAANTTRCGPLWDAAAGNLHAEVTHLAPASSDAGMLLVQAAQLSPGLGALLGEAGVAQIAFGAADAGDASVPVATFGGEGELADAARAVPLGADLGSYGNLGFSVDVPGDDSGAGHVWMSLAQAQQLVDPAQDPAAYYGLPRPYVLAVLGDPVAPHALTAGYDGHGLHLLVVAPARPSPAEAGVEGGPDGAQ
jgi:hypothetical protein